MALGSFTIDGTTIGTWARNARILKYMSGSRRGRNFQIPYRDGEYSDPIKWYTPTDIFLEVSFKWDDPDSNFSGFLDAISPSHSLVTLGASDTFHGSVQAKVELLGEPNPHAQDPTSYIFQLRNPKGVWEDATATTASGDPPSVTTTGDRPIDDMVFHFNTTGNVAHVDSLGTTSKLTLTAGASTGVVVDCGARTVKNGSTFEDAYLTVTQPYWMRWEANSTQNISSTGLSKVVYRNKYAI